METSIITWIDIKDARPLETGWYMVVLKRIYKVHGDKVINYI